MTNHFGKYAIISNVKHYFKEEPDWWWEIKPPTATEDLIMQNFMYGGPITEVRDGLRHENGRPTVLGTAIKEVSCLFAGTNIPLDPERPVSEGGEPVIKRDAPFDQVEMIVRTMPSPMIMEIWHAIGEALPTLLWGPASTKKKDDDGEEDGTDPK